MVEPLFAKAKRRVVVNRTPLTLEPNNNFWRMEVRGMLKGLFWVLMIGLFLYQMLDLFKQYLNELKTVAVSFEEKDWVEFPSFVFCDSRAFVRRVGMTSNGTLYNETALNVKYDVSLMFHPMNKETDTYSFQTFPTTFNGYCTLYEFDGKHGENTRLSK